MANTVLIVCESNILNSYCPSSDFGLVRGFFHFDTFTFPLSYGMLALEDSVQAMNHTEWYNLTDTETSPF